MMTEMDDPMVLESVLAERSREKQEAALKNRVFKNSTVDSPASGDKEVTEQVVGMEPWPPALTDSPVGDDMSKPGDGAQSETSQDEELALPMKPSEAGRVIELPFESSSFPSPNSGSFNDIAGKGTVVAQRKRKNRRKNWTQEETDNLLRAVLNTKKACSRMEQGTVSDSYWDAVAKAVPDRTGYECRGRMEKLKRSFSTMKKYCDGQLKEFKQLTEDDFLEMKVSPRLTEAWYTEIRDYCPPSSKKESKSNGAGSSSKSIGFVFDTSTLDLQPPVLPDGIEQGEPVLVELPGLTNYASITNEIRGEDKIEADIFHTDKGKSEVQLESKEIRNARKPTSIGDYLPIDLTRDLLGASSRGYVIRTICPDGQGGWYSCVLKRINTMDESEPDLARLCHPHVVHLFHHWKKKIDNGEVREWMPKSAFMTFLMMELMDGNLGNLMTSIKTTGLPPFSLLVAVHVMLQIAKGMLYLHEMGVSHPHLNCNNVLCRVKSTAQIPFRVGDVLVKLGGFGCSRAANDDTKNRDVFCFGLTCLEILTGDECFEDIYGADKVSRPSIPETTPFILKDCIANCLDTKITFSEAITLLLLAQSQIQTCEDKIILCSVNLPIKSTLSNKQDLASSSTSKSDRHEMFHVHQLHPQLGQKATSAQITLIFFHGFPKVSEEWRMTWLTRDNRLVWPQMWLPEDLDGDIRVLSVSFDDRANVSSIQSIKDLLQILVMSATCELGETDQAIVLVGHSFGGVIIKALVVAAQGLAGKTVENNVEFREVLKCKIFLKRLACIVFYSVPHAFANMEFENYISGCSNTRVLQRSLLLKDRRRDSVFISDMIQLSRDFENAVPRKTKRLAFLEGKPMSKKSLLVTENSCERLSLRWEWHKIDRDNHFEVCRPVSKSHIGYKVLLNHLQQLMCSLSAVKGNIDGESNEEPLRLLSRIVQTYNILATPGPFCCPASDEVLADLDGIVQCVPDSIKDDGETFSTLFRERAKGCYNIGEMNALVQKVTDFLDTSGSEFDRMVNDPEAKDIHLQSPSNLEDATLKSKRNFLRRMHIVAKTVDLYNKTVKNIEFLGLVGEVDAGKSTFIKKVIKRVGAAQDSGVPQVGMDSYTNTVALYKLRDQFYLVEFPGSNGTEKYADAWAQFTALPSSCILLLTFTGDMKKEQVQMYKQLLKDLDSKIAVVFNKVDLWYTPRNEKFFDAKYFENHRMKSAKFLGCDAEDVHYVCLDPDPEERLTKLRTVGVLGFEELAYKLGEWLGRHSDSESHRVLLDCLKTPVHERGYMSHTMVLP